MKITNLLVRFIIGTLSATERLLNAAADSYGAEWTKQRNIAAKANLAADEALKSAAQAEKLRARVKAILD